MFSIILNYIVVNKPTNQPVTPPDVDKESTTQEEDPLALLPPGWENGNPRRINKVKCIMGFMNCEYGPVYCECNMFFQCLHYKYNEYYCPNGLLFNSTTKRCDIAENVDCQFPPPKCGCDCTYLPYQAGECTDKYVFQDYPEIYQGSHHCQRVERTCDSGLYWDESILPQGACNVMESVPACTAKKTMAQKPNSTKISGNNFMPIVPIS